MVSVTLSSRRCTFNMSGGRPRLGRRIGSFITRVGSGNGLSRVYGGCFTSNAPRNVASTARSPSGSRLIITAGTRFTPFRCGRNSRFFNVSVRVTGLLTRGLGGRLMVISVTFSTILLSIRRNGTSVNVTNLAMARRETRRISFSSSCCSTSRGLVIGRSSAAFSGYGAGRSISTVLGNFSSDAAVNNRGNAANRFCIRNDRSFNFSGLGTA